MRRRPEPLRLRLALLALASCSALACRSRAEPSESRPGAAPPGPEPATSAHISQAAPFQSDARCRVSHGGQFLDLGTDASHARRSFALGPFSDLASDTWSDQSYTRFASPRVQYDLWVTRPEQDLEVRVRAKAGASGVLSASIDQMRLGSLRVSAEGFQTLVFPKPKQPLAVGRHQLGLRWSGKGGGDTRSLGMIEWIHFAERGLPVAEYRAPRQRSLRDDMIIGGVPRRSIVLEAPGSIACPVLLARDAKLSLGVGYQGDGTGVARVVVQRDSGAREVLAERRVSSKSGEAWADLSLDLAPFRDQLVLLSLEAVSDSASGRIAFSEPRLVAPDPPVTPPRAKLAVLVVASGLHRELLPPFEGSRRLRHASYLAERSTRFPDYRVPSTVVGAVMATLLSGLPPQAHALVAPKMRLGRDVLMLGERLRESSGESAFFTGVPSTRRAFGFDRGWNEFEELSPVNDVAASAPLERAREWIEGALARDRAPTRLVAVHVRGGHPPWDLSREQVAELEPREYMGLLEARRGGMILSHVRHHPRPAQRRLAAPDWLRLRALQLAALEKQDAALGALIELLQREQVWDDTLFIFAGDVAMGDPPEVPFGSAPPLGEDRLLVPLWVKFPAGHLAGSEVAGAVTSADVTTTLAGALGIALPEALPGVGLYRLASGAGPLSARGLLASLGQEYSLRQGRWLLHGVSPKPPLLCELGVDPACVHDVIAEFPLAAEALWRTAFEAHRRERTLELPGGGNRAEPALLDRDTAAALQVWGD